MQMRWRTLHGEPIYAVMMIVEMDFIHADLQCVQLVF
jgi:hypothetical protein